MREFVFVTLLENIAWKLQAKRKEFKLLVLSFFLLGGVGWGGEGESREVFFLILR